MWVTIWFTWLLANMAFTGIDLTYGYFWPAMWQLALAMVSMVLLGVSLRDYIRDAGSLDTYTQQTRYAEQFRNPNNI